MVKEVYRIGIGFEITGDKEVKQKLTATEKMAEQTKRKMNALGKITANPTAKLNDKATSTINKIESKARKLSNTSITTTANLKDNATFGLSKVNNATEKLNNKEAKVKVKAQDEASSVIEKANSKLNSWLKAGAKKIISIGLAGSLAVGGLGLGASLKTYTDFEQGLSNVKAVTNATSQEMATLKNEAKSLGASTAWSAVQVTQAEELLGQAGFSVKETTSALPGLLSLASAGSLDLASATDIASGTLRAFNLQASQSGHVADVLALSASATNSDVTDLGETMKYAAPVAQALGISFEDTAAASGLLSNANIKGSQAGTVLRQTMARLASPTKEAAKVMQQYGINAFDTQGNMKPLSGVIDNLNSSLGKLTSQQRADVISTIFGTESMSGVLALMNQGGQSLSDLSKNLSSADGAAKKMADTKLDNLAGQWTILKSAVEGMKIELGERLAPYAKQFVTWFTGKIPDITNGVVGIVDSISKHTDDIKSVAVAIGGIVTAIAGFNIAGSIGNSISGISNLVSLFKGASVAKDATEAAAGISKVGLSAKILPALFSPVGLAITAGVAATAVGVHEYNKLMNESILTAKEDLDPIERFMDSISGNVHKSKAELKGLKLIYDDFGDGISDSFKEAAKNSSQSLLEIEMNLNRLTKSGTLDEGGVSTFKNYVNDFAYEGINAMKEKRDKIASEFNKTFMLDGVLNETEQNVTSSLSEYFETGINKQMQIREDVYGILNEAFVDHSKDLDTAMSEIKEKLAEMKALELEYTKADNAYEKAYAQNQYKNDAEKVTGLDGASELLKSRADEHNKQLDEIDNNYAGTLAYYDSLLSSSNITDEERSNFEAGKAEAQKARDEALKQAEEDWKSDLETLYSAFPKAKDKNGRSLLNEETGAVLSDKELKSQNAQQKIEDSHSQLEGVTTSGVYTLQNDTTKNLETLYVNFDETTGKIKGIINGTTGDVGAYSDEQKEKLMNLQDEYSNTGSAMQKLVTDQAMLNTSTDEVFNHFGDVVGQLENVQTATDGTVTGILNIKGTPIQITSNADGTIVSMNEVNSSIEKIPDSKAADVDTNASETLGEFIENKNALDNIPQVTPADISTNASEASGEVGGLLSNLKEIGSKVWTGIVNITKNVTEAFTSSNDAGHTAGHKEGYATGTLNATQGVHPVAESGFEIVVGRQNRLFSGGEKVLNHKESKSFLQNAMNYSKNNSFITNNFKSQQIKEGYATGTLNATQGVHPVAESGFEIILGKQHKLFSNDIMYNVQKESNIKSKPIGLEKSKNQYKLVEQSQPQVSIAGAAGNQFSFNFGGININANKDVEVMIEEAMQQFGKNLRDVLTNIKK